MSDDPTVGIPDTDAWHDANGYDWPIPWQPLGPIPGDPYPFEQPFQA